MIYTYKCEKCDKEYEIWQKMNDAHEYKCELCSEKTIRIWDKIPFKFTFWYGYDDGLGQYVDNKTQRDNILKEKGFSIAS